nr:bacteriocin immunity protein [Pseudomonas lundensis]
MARCSGVGGIQRRVKDDRTDLHLLHCQKVSEHPAGPDLICSPELGADNGPWFRISRTT